MCTTDTFDWSNWRSRCKIQYYNYIQCLQFLHFTYFSSWTLQILGCLQKSQKKVIWFTTFPSSQQSRQHPKDNSWNCSLSNLTPQYKKYPLLHPFLCILKWLCWHFFEQYATVLHLLQCVSVGSRQTKQVLMIMLLCEFRWCKGVIEEKPEID